MDERSERIGRLIRKIRESRGLSLDDLSRKVGVSRQQLSRLERADRTLRPGMIMKIANALGVPVSTLESEAEGVGALQGLLELLGCRTVKSPDLRYADKVSDSDFQGADLVVQAPSLLRRTSVVVAYRPSAELLFVFELARFIEQSKAGYDQGLLVTLEPPSDEAVKRAGKLVLIRTYDDLISDFLDLRDYARGLVEQRVRRLDEFFQEPECEVGGDARQRLSSMAAEWLADPDSPSLVLHGEPGVGKSTTMAWLNAWIAGKFLEQPYECPAPILLRFWEMAPDEHIHEALQRELAARVRGADVSPALVKHLLRSEKLVVLLDGLDEALVRPDPYLTSRILRDLWQLRSSGCRFVLSARTRTFPRVDQIDRLLSPPTFADHAAESLPPLRVAEIVRFDLQGVEEYLRRRKPSSWRQILDLIGSRQLGGLATLPLALRLISENIALTVSGPRSMGALLHEAVLQWARQDPALAGPASDDERFKLLEEVAYHSWRLNKSAIYADVLPNDCVKTLEWAGSPSARGEQHFGPDSSLFLARNDLGQLFIPNRVFQEYLLAMRVIRELRIGRDECLRDFWFTPLTEELAATMLGSQGVRRQLRQWLVSHNESSMRSAAAYLLGLGMVDAESIHALLDTAYGDDEKNVAVRGTALYALSRVGNARARNTLMSQSREPAPSLTRLFARVLLVILDAPQGRTPGEAPGSRDTGPLWSRTELLNDMKQVLRASLDRTASIDPAARDEAFLVGIIRATPFVADAEARELLAMLKQQPGRRLDGALDEALQNTSLMNGSVPDWTLPPDLPQLGA